MGCVSNESDANGNRFWTLFDSGAISTYVVKSVSALLPTVKLPKPVERRLGGENFIVEKASLLVGTIDGYGVTADAMVLDHLFPDEHGRSIEIIFGAEAMERWGISIDMVNRRLDFTHYAQEAIEG